MKKCPSNIRCQDSNPRTLERESLPITTRPGLPEYAELRTTRKLLIKGLLLETERKKGAGEREREWERRINFRSHISKSRPNRFQHFRHFTLPTFDFKILIFCLVKIGLEAVGNIFVKDLQKVYVLAWCSIWLIYFKIIFVGPMHRMKLFNSMIQ